MFLIYKTDEDDVPETPRPDPIPETPRPDPLPQTPRPEPTPDEWDDQYSEDPRHRLIDPVYKKLFRCRTKLIRKLRLLKHSLAFLTWPKIMYPFLFPPPCTIQNMNI